MEAFYQYVYGNLLYLIIAAIGISILGMVASRRGKRRLGRRLLTIGVVTDFAVAGIYLTSFALVRYSNDMLMTILWAGLGYWNYRQLKGR